MAAPLTRDINPVLTLEDEQGAVWAGVLPRENDLRAFYPPQNCQSGEHIRWDFDLVVNPDIPAGNYKLVVRVLDGGSSQPIFNEAGQDWFILERIVIE